MVPYKIDTSDAFVFPGDVEKFASASIFSEIPGEVLRNLDITILLGVNNVGRDTLLASVLEALDLDQDSVVKRCTTRARRQNDLFMNFFSRDEFEQKLTKNDILTYILWGANQQYYGLEKDAILEKKDLGRKYFMESTYIGLVVKAIFKGAKLILIMPENDDQMLGHFRISKKNQGRKEKNSRLSNARKLLGQMRQKSRDLFGSGFVDAVIVNRENAVEETTTVILNSVLHGSRPFEI